MTAITNYNIKKNIRWYIYTILPPIISSIFTFVIIFFYQKKDNNKIIQVQQITKEECYGDNKDYCTDFYRIIEPSVALKISRNNIDYIKESIKKGYIVLNNHTYPIIFASTKDKCRKVVKKGYVIKSSIFDKVLVVHPSCIGENDIFYKK
jgi:hypothetical protein